ncbi:MAG TPA: glycine--tRNA ligase subunit beta [Stellaceae bacterium]|nr:glycine--tRNA ligase subunit beta [Stellaceae bacterium]
MPELLLELLSEEIPARMQRRAIEEFSGLVWKKLQTAGLSPAGMRAHATPRRLVVIVEGIAAAQPDLTEERRGPRLGAPPQAVEGFLRAAGLASLDQCEVRDTGRGEFYFAVLRRPGRDAAHVVPELIHAAMAELPWPKSMRYPASPLRWVRPLNSVVCLLDGEVVPLALGRVPVGRTTRGHRFLSPAEIEVAGAADYLAKLQAANVVLAQERRREMIQAELDRLAGAAGLAAKPDPALLDEVTGLVEYPVVLMGTIDAEFVKPLPQGLPPEVLATAMRTHQKYFSCLKPDGSPAPHFLFVANNRTPDGGKTVIGGNERVLRARLSDARFFWDQDRRVRLDDRVAALKQRVYHEKLGSVYDKVERMEALAAFLAAHVRWPDSPGQPQAVMPGLDPGIPAPSNRTADGMDGRVKPGHDGQKLKRLAQRAARLAKADLSTGMVGEFPELQGVMGRYYALNDGEDPAVADAVAAHYKPLGPSDSCPSEPVAVAVALADKIDALTAFFAVSEAPTGSRDPYALRRAALGVIRLILENNVRLSLRSTFAEAGRLLAAPAEEAVTEALLTFIADRIKVHLRERGVRHDLIAAVFALREDDLVRLLARVDALSAFLASEDGANLLTAYRRAANIVTIEERRDGRAYDAEPDKALLSQPEEQALARALRTIGGAVADASHGERFSEAMDKLAALRPAVDAFFDKVTVNTDRPELRVNRLRLLSRIRATMNQVADFSQIEG